MMRRYRFKVLEIDTGEFREGILEAESAAAAAAVLQAKDYRVVTLTEKRLWNPLRCLRRRKVWAAGEIALFAKQLAVLIDAGVDLLKALSLLAQMRSSKYRAGLEQMAAQIAGGSSFASAAEKAGFLPPLAYYLIQAGEQSGALAENLLFIEEHYREEARLRKEWEEALTYPLIVVVLAFAVAMLSFFVILPIFAEFFRELGVVPQGDSLWIFSLAEFVRTHMGIISFVFLATTFSLWVFFQSEYGMLLRDRAGGKIRFIRYRNYARICRVMAVLLAGGVDFRESLHLAANVSNNSIYRSRLLAVENEVANGVEPVQALQKNGITEPIFLHMLAIGMESGRMPDLLREAAALYDSEAKKISVVLRTWLGPVVLVLVGIWVGFIIFSVMSPLIEAMTAPIR